MGKDASIARFHHTAVPVEYGARATLDIVGMSIAETWHESPCVRTNMMVLTY